VQTRNSETSETVSVTSGNCDKITVGDGQTKLTSQASWIPIRLLQTVPVESPLDRRPIDVLAEEGAIKNAIAAAIGPGAIQRMGASAFQGAVNVAGTYIKFTGAFTPSGVVVSNVMGAALQK
jgi:hypothetical protein